tara:strand:+ start:996 stop:1133 length:138 start_codon:yes stop_codon:yes gene_type:complete
MTYTTLDIIGVAVVVIINFIAMGWFARKMKLDLLKDEKDENDQNN